MAEYTYKYPHPAVTTDCVVFGFDGRELKVLLIERGLDPYKGMWAFPGGFMMMDETAEECALRELREETGMEVDFIRQIGTFSGVNRDPRERVISVVFYSLARKAEVRGGDDAAKARWWNLDEIPQLAFDHDYILRQAMIRIRQDIHFEPIGFGLLGEQFTIAELQRLYESILGVRFDRRNFYKKMLMSGIIQEVDEPEPFRPSYFGRHREMKSMSIDSLFGGGASEKHAAMPSPAIDLDQPCAAPVCCEAEEPVRERQHPGRKGKLFRFDKERYERLKESGSFRLEF